MSTLIQCVCQKGSHSESKCPLPLMKIHRRTPNTANSMVMGYHSTRPFRSSLPPKPTDTWIVCHYKRMCFRHRAPSGPPEGGELFKLWSFGQSSFPVLEVPMDSPSYTSVRCKCSLCAHGNKFAGLYHVQDASSLGPDALLYYPATHRLDGTGSAKGCWEVKI